MGEGEATDALSAFVPPRVPAPWERCWVDDGYMRRALGLAARGIGLVSPNPLVGAVLVQGDDVVGEGWHQGPGRPHAEVRALETAGDRARGATMFVTLEPCAHHGRTPPCAPRVAEAGVSRVVAAMSDPNPLVDGQGFDVLRRQGVEVEIGLLAEEAAGQNAAFLTHVRTGVPLVTLKLAMSLDGKVAAGDGSSRWISGEDARAEVHRMRAAADAVVVGAGTVIRDDPALTVREPTYQGPPVLRVVVDGRGSVPFDRAVFTDGRAPTLVATTESASSERRAEWSRAGAEVLVLDDEGRGRLPLEALLAELGKRDIQSVLLEGGPDLAWDALRRGVVDQLVLFVAPVLIGGRDAPSALMGDGVASIADALRAEIVESARIGEDLKVVCRVHRDR
jgi:diaminohydroxyphosphoribosylaminopyrimidine deaminase/5-amino-6-(5-phosphoribosylamino)uracil reductase